VSQATLFVGSGATLDMTTGAVALPSSNDPKAVGFSVSNGALDLGIFSARSGTTDGTNYVVLNQVRKYTGFEGSLGRAQLQGVDAVQLIGTSMVLQLNRTSVSGGRVLNWSLPEVTSANVALGPNSPTFRIGGSAGLSIAGVVFGSATVDVSRSVVSGVDDPDDAGTRKLQGDLLGVSISNATLFIGSGARLDLDATSATFGSVTLPASDDPRAVGFSVAGGSLDLGIFTARDSSPDGVAYTALDTYRKYTGLEGAMGRGQLQGVDAVKIIGKDLVLKLNQTTVSGGAVLDWRQAPVAGALVALGPMDPKFRIGGSVGLSIADVVFGSATIDVSRSEVSGIIDPDVVPGGVLKGDLLGISVTEATLFIGSGASLDTDSNSLNFGKVSTPASNDPAAVGFSLTGGSLKWALFTARAVVSGNTATEIGARK
jgi:hypothetical protein